jgi:rRNA maturation protein Nop10
MVMQNMRCPGCGEETFEDELIAGKCPLCGAKIKEPVEQPSGGSSNDPFITCVPDYDEMPFDMANSSVVDRMYDFFGDMFTVLERSLLISRIAYDISQNTGLELKQARKVARDVVDQDQAEFEFKVQPEWYDEFKIKKCAKCGRKHLMVGKKVLKGWIKDDDADYEIEYICRHCL